MFKIAKQHFFIREGFVELKLVDESSVKSRLNESVVLHALLVLLPLEVQEGRSAVVRLHPGGTRGEYSSDQCLVVALAEIVLSSYGGTVRGLGGARGLRMT